MLTFLKLYANIIEERKMMFMASLTSAINVNVDTKTKEEATNILKGLGLNMSTAINMFLAQIVKRDGIPFEVVNPKPNKDMIMALKEVDEMINNPNKYPRYDNWEDLKKSLLSDD